MSSTATELDPSRFQLPGFTLPVGYSPDAPQKRRLSEALYYRSTDPSRVLFRNALDSQDVDDLAVHLPLTTIRELTMLRLMNKVTDKVDWHLKVFDETITAKWRKEALESEQDISEKMIDWCLAELQYKARVFQETGCVHVYNGNVLKSDTAIPESLRRALQDAVKPLENISSAAKDWHPGSDGKVLELVHPSLFPVAYAHTRILPDSLINRDNCLPKIGCGQTLPVPANPTNCCSKEHQWLPCDVEFLDKGLKIVSYINNLHPQKHHALYSIIEDILCCTIPLWNETLSGLKYPENIFSRIPYAVVKYNRPPDAERPKQEPEEDSLAFYIRYDEWDVATRTLAKPEPGVFLPPPPPLNTVDLKRDYGHRGLQVIVKLANIELTPEKPTYGGGSWHIEGMLNERICASAIYYYDSVNISGDSLAFRQQVIGHRLYAIFYDQWDWDWLSELFGCQQNKSAIQEVGSVDTRQGRLLTWPNILQHQVQPFKLANATEPGHRKILALFLVDPNIRIISTANVPPQRKDWWAEEILKPGPGGETWLTKLPVEVQDIIFEMVEEFPLDLDAAKQFRLKLMEERKDFVHSIGNSFVDQIFSLCEH